MSEDPEGFYAGPAPDELRGDSFLLRPLRPEDNPLDYAAMCDRWETQAWIAKGNSFTPEKNLEALRRHTREHRARQAFTFTIMNPGETECLGCLYVTPLLPLLQARNASKSVQTTITEKDAAVRFWLRDAYRRDEWEERLLRALLGWLKEACTFPHLLFHTSAADRRQRDLFESYRFELICLLELSYGAFYEPPPLFLIHHDA